jgi:beta-xylosidase
MKGGDYAGLAAFQKVYGMIGVYVGADERKMLLLTQNDPDSGEARQDYLLPSLEIIHLKIAFDFENGRDLAEFYFSVDGEKWESLGGKLQMLYNPGLFIGYRIGIFYFAQKETGGFADFRDFKMNM